MAAPGIARIVGDGGPESPRFKNAGLWLALAAQLLVLVYTYGQLTARVESQGKQLDRIENRLEKIAR